MAAAENDNFERQEYRPATFGRRPAGVDACLLIDDATSESELKTLDVLRFVRTVTKDRGCIVAAALNAFIAFNMFENKITPEIVVCVMAD